MVMNLLLATLSFLSLSLLFVLLFFTVQSRGQIMQMDTVFEDTQVFNLIDNRGYDNDFMWQENALERLKEFYYDTLIVSDNFLAASIIPQFLEIDADEFRGEESFQHGYEHGFHAGVLSDGQGNRFYQINSVQINQIGWELFPVEVAVGRGFEDADFEERLVGGTVPIILGSNYAGYYEIGDIITADYLFLAFDFEVVGILAENQRTFQFTADYFLDNYMIIPHFSLGEPQSNAERESQTSIYRNKALWTFLFVDDTPEAIDYMKNTIHTAATELGIPYDFNSMDEAFIRYRELSNLINHNLTVINTLFIGSALLIGLIIFIFTKMKYNRRKNVYYTQFLLGIPMSKQMKAVILENLIIYISVIALALYYAVFYSGLILTAENIMFMEQNNASRLYVFWHTLMNDIFDRHITLYQTALYGGILFIISSVYPMIKIKFLYTNKGRSQK